jgi:hypothetical protein
MKAKTHVIFVISVLAVQIRKYSGCETDGKVFKQSYEAHGIPGRVIDN